MRGAWQWHAWAVRSSSPLATALACGAALFTGYELVVVYNGDTVTTVNASGDLQQSYVHR